MLKILKKCEDKLYHILLFAPLIGAVFTGLFTRAVSAKFAQFTTCTLIILSFILSVSCFLNIASSGNVVDEVLFTWIKSGNLHLSWGIYIDSLTSVMLIVVTSVSMLVHIYSIGYMHDDPHQQRFMSYLSLFTFCMLMLVTANNFLQLFFGWEGVGLSSYLLIGFWFQKQSANDAAMKAFIVNRIADLAFIFGIITIFAYTDHLDFQYIFNHSDIIAEKFIIIGQHKIKFIEFTCLLLFIGCMGKSAQLFLHTWLPDAMEGPTPVSALIHAATMVTAGVFLLARCSPLFEHAPHVREFITIIGALTSIFAASIALTQLDIKKIIAYSTCSQLGYMFFACGVSAYNAAIFHLMTHAFFKALLFLGAGSVIHAVAGEQNINNMGGIWKKIPQTFIMMIIGSLALVGIYPFAGFYSKDIILEAAYTGGRFGNLAYCLGIIAAFMTAFYSWRLIIKVFNNHTNMTHENYHHVHESPMSMRLPLYVLSIGAIIAGFIGVKLGMINENLSFWHGSIYINNWKHHFEQIEHLPFLVTKLPLIVGALGITFAYFIYMPNDRMAQIIAKIISPFYKLSYHKFYIDEIYNLLFVQNFKKLSLASWKIIDVDLIDNCGPNGFANFAKKCTLILSKMQTGLIYHYISILFFGLIVMVSWLVYNF